MYEMQPGQNREQSCGGRQPEVGSNEEIPSIAQVGDGSGGQGENKEGKRTGSGHERQQ